MQSDAQGGGSALILIKAIGIALDRQTGERS
jgi:hypothetical protein